MINDVYDKNIELIILSKIINGPVPFVDLLLEKKSSTRRDFNDKGEI